MTSESEKLNDLRETGKAPTLDELLDGLTMEATFVAEVKRRSKQNIRDQFGEVRDLIALIHLEHASKQTPEECQRFRRVYDLVLEKIKDAS